MAVLLPVMGSEKEIMSRQPKAQKLIADGLVATPKNKFQLVMHPGNVFDNSALKKSDWYGEARG
jgi:hypothetical protein